MRRSLRRRATLLLFLIVPGIAPARALEVPLSRASFERAIQEGGSCRRLEAKSSYVLVKRATESILASVIDALAQSYLSQEISQSFVTIRLATPYTRVMRAACRGKLLGEPIDAASLWETARASTTVSLWVETATNSTKNDRESLDDQARYGLPPDTTRTSGPRVIGLALRRGDDRGAVLVQPISGGGGVEYDFPATALQGKGPFYAIVRTEEPEAHLTLELKRSTLREP